MITFDKEKLEKYIEEYKANFEQINREEIYKWCFVKIFQDNWNIEALNFKGMFANAVADKTITPFSGNKKETNNILETFRHYPRQFLLALIDVEPETVRTLFKNLFDESKSVTERNRIFQEETQELYNKYKSNPNFSTFSYSYQRNLSVSYYLFLRYPNKYYISKYKVMKYCAEKLNAVWTPKNADFENIEKCREFFDSICEVVKEDKELLSLSEKRLQNDLCFKDPSYKILTQDIVWFIANKQAKLEKIDDWEPSLKEYDPGITTEKWLELLQKKDIFDDNSIKVLKSLYEFPDGASCKELAEKFGGQPQFYNNVSWNLGRRVHEVTNCPLFAAENEEEKCWPVVYVGKKQDKKKDGVYVWKVRAELMNALKKVFNAKVNINPYTKQNFLNEVFMTETDYDKLVALLKYKKNIILQGAPGVGKTFTAKRLAYSLIGTEDDSRIAMVQFHQNYSYEDFVMGYRPSENGFELRSGVFYDFCETARNDINNEYYFIIDEINRANLSSVFGELLMLVENDYRDKHVNLVYKKDELFSVPHNVYIIGMMNTADRSIAMIDYALRRRFSFFTMKPGFESNGFMVWQHKVSNDVFNTLIEKIKKLNADIVADDSLGEGFCIGHSYFVYDEKNIPANGVEAWLRNVVYYDICPMLDEYWFDDKQKSEHWQNELTGIFSK